MGTVTRRARAIREQVTQMRVAATPEVSGMEQWARILRDVLPVIEIEASDDPAAQAAVARVHRTWALIAEADASGRPWAYLEYFCHACVLRMHWPVFVPAFLDPEYATQLDEIERIERARGTPIDRSLRSDC